jgi:hypothetical protein
MAINGAVNGERTLGRERRSRASVSGAGETDRRDAAARSHAARRRLGERPVGGPHV